jgi:hypothetical protein
MIGQRLFSLLTLLGCLAPSITPRHFPVHAFHVLRDSSGAMVAGSVAENPESTLAARGLDSESLQTLQLAEQ